MYYICDIDSIIGSHDYELLDEYRSIENSHSIIKIFVHDYTNLWKISIPTKTFLSDIFIGYHNRKYSSSFLGAKSSFLADRDRQKLIIRYNHKTYPCEFKKCDNILESAILMGICNQVACVPMMRPIIDYIHFFLDPDMMLIDRTKTPLYFIIDMKESPLSFVFNNDEDDFLNISETLDVNKLFKTEESFSIKIKKQMSITKYQNSEMRIVGKVTMIAKINYNGAFNLIHNSDEHDIDMNTYLFDENILCSYKIEIFEKHIVI